MSRQDAANYAALMTFGGVLALTSGLWPGDLLGAASVALAVRFGLDALRRDP